MCHTPSRPTRKPLPEFSNFLCNSPHSVSLKHLLAALSGAGKTGGLIIDTHVSRGQQGNSDRRRAKLETEILEAEKRKRNAQQLGVMGAIAFDLVIQTNATEDAIIAKRTSDLAQLTFSAVEQRRFAGEYARRTASLGDRLRDDSLTLTERTRLLDAAGLDRIYVDKPLLRLHFRD